MNQLDPQHILDHNEEKAYLQEITRQAVIQILSTADPQEILDQPEHFIEQLIAAVLLAIAPYTRRMADQAQKYAQQLGHAALTDAEMADEEEKAKKRFFFAILPALNAAILPIEATVRTMLDDGVSAAVIDAAISTDAGVSSLFGSFNATVKNFTVGYLNDIEHSLVMRAAAPPPALNQAPDQVQYTWIAVMDKNTCEDEFENSCAPRHGASLTWGEWGAMGRPQSRNLICCMVVPRCRCELTQKDATTVPAPVVISAAIAAGKSRAK